MDLYPFKSALGLIEPIAIQNQNVCIHYGKAEFYRKVDFYEAIPPTQFWDLGAIPAGFITARTIMTAFELPNNEFGQFRWFTLDNAQIRFFLPSGAGKAELRLIQAVFDKTIVDKDPDLHLTEFGVWQNNPPAIEAINFMDYPLAACRIVAFGFRYHSVELVGAILDAVKAGKEPCTHFWCSGKGA